MSSQHFDNQNNSNENYEQQSKGGCISKWENLSSNVRALAVSTMLFMGISSAQVIFALSVNSIALLADAAAMYVDVACYVAALIGECLPASRAGFKRVYGLIVSFLSIAILLALSIYFLHESVVGITTMQSIEWSKSASEQLNNPLPDMFGRNASGVVEAGYGLSETVKSLESLSAPNGILTRRIAVNGISATIFDGILPYNVSEAEACPDLGPGDKCDMDDNANSGTVMLAFGLTGLLIDLICLGYAFLMPRRCGNNKTDDDEGEENEQDETEKVQDDNGEHQNINTLAAYAHVAADVVRSCAAIVAASYILAGGRGSEYADDIAGAVSSCTIILGSLVGMWEWWCDLCDHQAEQAQEPHIKMTSERESETMDGENSLDV